MANIDEVATAAAVAPVPPEFADEPSPSAAAADSRKFVTFQDADRESATAAAGVPPPPGSEPAVSFLTASASGDDSVLNLTRF